jgi:hypothetical protein
MQTKCLRVFLHGWIEINIKNMDMLLSELVSMFIFKDWSGNDGSIATLKKLEKVGWIIILITYYSFNFFTKWQPQIQR